MLWIGISSLIILLLMVSLANVNLKKSNNLPSPSTQELTGIKSTAQAEPSPFKNLTPTMEVSTVVPIETTLSTVVDILPTAPANPILPAAAPTPESKHSIRGQLEAMSDRQKIGQLLLIGITGEIVTPQTCSFMKEISPAGVVLRPGNVSTPKQLQKMTEDLQACSQINGDLPLLIALDHEGQYVTRFNSGVTIFPAALAQGATGQPALTYQAAYVQGQELTSVGVNMILGPVADVLANFDNTVISQRSFGADPASASQFVSQAVLGFQDAGLISSPKHFPGHGGTAEDSHVDLPMDPIDVNVLEQVYLPTFRASIQAGAPVVMLSHVVFPNIDPNGLPASLSPVIINILRTELDFEGVILTDSIGMGAIKDHWSMAEASLMAVQAGADMLITSSTTTARDAQNGLLVALQNGNLSAERIDESVQRVLALKAGQELDQFSVSGYSLPDMTTNRALADRIGFEAVTILRDEANLIPIPEDKKRLLIISPPDAWGLIPAIQQTLTGNGRVIHHIEYPAPWDDVIKDHGLAASLIYQAREYDLIIYLTWDAHLKSISQGDAWQSRLAQKLISSANPVIIIALKSPTDFVDFPTTHTYIATFGTTPGQIQALANILSGQAQAYGRNPLPGIIP
jgi:beta-N-acetylhexosaminidase